MDEIQPSSSMPHIVQIAYEPAEAASKVQNPQILDLNHTSLQTQGNKISYDHTKLQHIPLPTDLQPQPLQMSDSQILMSYQQSHLIQDLSQQVPTHMTSHIMPNPNMAQPVHVILPQMPVYKEHHLMVDEMPQHYYGQFNTNPVETTEVAKTEPEFKVTEEKQIECKPENVEQIEVEPSIDHLQKRKRSDKPNPGNWACNVRKLKHQRGEAYISRRGKFVPERKVKTTKNCLQSCKFMCSERINNTDREHIFKAFYSLNANEKKHFLLNTTERICIKHKSPDENPKRKHSFKYFFLVRAVRHPVCKNFYLGTLAISQKPVYNVHLGKSEMNIPKPDGRGLSEASIHALPSETKDRVRKHIMSFSTENSKPIKQFSKKKQYLVPILNIKQMYNMYLEECKKDNVSHPVKESMYRKIFKEEFNLHFRRVKPEQQLCCQCKGVIKKKC